jgi:hypothetical protein
MELPDDVLQLVREYSRPVFRYVREYNQFMRLFGKKNWSVLKEKLHTDPEHVLPAIYDYQDALIRKKEIHHTLDNSQSDSEKEILLYRVFYSNQLEEDLFWQLIRLLYEGKSYWEFRIEWIE